MSDPPAPDSDRPPTPIDGNGTDDNRTLPLIRVNKAAWRASALLLMIAACVAIVALVAQTTIWPGSDTDKDDPLATLALTLAILAFIVQIMVYVFQTNASNSALRRSEQVNMESQGFLREIRVASRKTLEAQDRQFERLLTFVMELVSDQRSPGGGALEASPDGIDDDESDTPDITFSADPSLVSPSGDYTGSLLDAMRQRRTLGTSGSSGSEEDQRIRDYLLTYPERAEVDDAVRTLAKLAPYTLVQLKGFVDQEVRQRSEGQRVGLKGPAKTPMTRSSAELTDAGLIAPIPGLDGFYALTDKGREVGRVIAARNVGRTASQPDWWYDVLDPLLQKPSA